MRRPDFFLVGAPKCGTTALYAMLGAHPEIFVSPTKEPDFFAADVRAAVRAKFAGSNQPPPRLRRSAEASAKAEDPASEEDDWSRYLGLFSGAAPNQRAGEGSVSYLASRVAAEAIHGRCPDARILMVLRDPADRLFSHYTAALVARATRGSFSEWLAEKISDEAATIAPIGPVVAGRYGSHLHRYLNVFPASRIHIVWYEDFVDRAEETVREVLRFLGVNDTQKLPTSLRLNETRIPRWGGLWSTRPASEPSPPERALGLQIYRDDIHLLASLTGRDLSRWIDSRG